MRSIGGGCLILLAVVLGACGGSSGPAAKDIHGLWIAQLKNPDGTLGLMFATNLTQGSGSALDISNFSITSPSPCFTSTTGQSGTFIVTGSSGGYQTGPFAMTVSTAFGTAVKNVATLTGTRNSDGSITGNWTLTGLVGCNNNGTFTMAPPPPV